MIRAYAQIKLLCSEVAVLSLFWYFRMTLVVLVRNGDVCLMVSSKMLKAFDQIVSRHSAFFRREGYERRWKGVTWTRVPQKFPSNPGIEIFIVWWSSNHGGWSLRILENGMAGVAHLESQLPDLFGFIHFRTSASPSLSRHSPNCRLYLVPGANWTFAC